MNCFMLCKYWIGLVLSGIHYMHWWTSLHNKDFSPIFTKVLACSFPDFEILAWFSNTYVDLINQFNAFFIYILNWCHCLVEFSSKATCTWRLFQFLFYCWFHIFFFSYRTLCFMCFFFVWAVCDSWETWAVKYMVA